MSETETEDMELVEFDDYPDGTLHIKLFGDNPRGRVLTVLVGKHTTDLSISEIARLAGVSRSTIYDQNIIEDLQDLGVVVKTREVGQGKMYQLNPDNPVAVKLAEINRNLTHRAINEAVQE